VEAAMAASDQLPPLVTAAMVLPDYPIGPVDKSSIQREANAMLEFGFLGSEYATEVSLGTLVESMITADP
jgi:hypothetical protein